jgi:DNA replication initiation complex subunit (GINS family)
MSEDKINITYETLLELLRTESNRGELQKLNETFIQDIVNYIKDKKNTLAKIEKKVDLFSSTEKEKTSKLLSNTIDIIKKIYDRRERKIVNMAIDKSRIKESIVDTSCLLEEEKLLFDLLVELLYRFRSNLLYNIIEAQLPKKSKLEKREEREVVAEKKEEIGKKKEHENPTKMIRFIHPVPQFLGRDLEKYGPFEEEDVANLPTELANVLINKGRAEGI